VRILVVADAGSIHTQRWVRGLVGRGHQVGVVSERAWPDAPVAVQTIPPAGRGRWNLPWAVRRLESVARSFRPDVVHAHYASHYGLLAALAGYRPLVVSVWGADVEVFPERRALNRRLLAWTLNRADRVTATSRHLAAVAARYRRGRVDVVPWGLEPVWFEGGVPEPPPTPFTVVCNKHLERVYGPDLLIRALAPMPGEWRLALLGEGSARRELEALARDLGVAERVEWPGRLDPAGVRRWLDAAHVACFPSRRESFSVATLEASARGRPVVAARVGGLPEVVEDGVTGLLIPPEDVDALRDALATLAGDAARRTAMGDAGRRWVASRYRWEQSLEAMEAVYVGRNEPCRS
jgi:glycosyltransferase involved in cell wall biosynthesis